LEIQPPGFLDSGCDGSSIGDNRLLPGTDPEPSSNSTPADQGPAPDAHADQNHDSDASADQNGHPFSGSADSNPHAYIHSAADSNPHAYIHSAADSNPHLFY
jgi:hypothetical protein